jgi:ubiquinone/menaquinone biosynthesis C-methylase UbiE
MDKTKIAVEVFNKLANLYESKFMNVDLYSESFDLFCKSIETENAEVLELACGPGNITKYLLNKRPDFNILGTDLAPNMIDLAKKNNPNAEFRLLDCREILTLDQKFDAIISGFCLPYLTKEEAVQFIINSFEVLKPGGILYISTMEDDYSKSGLKKGSTGDEIFMHYHELEYLKEAIELAKMKIIKFYRQNFPTQDGTKVVDLIIIAQKL